MPSFVCPFGIYCPQGHNKRYQPNGVCFHFWAGKCTEEKKIYEQEKIPELSSIDSFRGESELGNCSPSCEPALVNLINMEDF